MEININKIDEVISVSIDGAEIPNVKDYQVKSSASGETELVITITGTVSVLELLTSSIK